MTIGNGGNYTVTTSDSNITVNGGEVVSYAVSTGGHGIVVGGSNSIVNIEGDALVQAGSQFGILVNTDAVNVEININGGTVKSNGYAICLNGQGEINVNGGTVEGSGAGIYLAGTTDNKTTVNIESGTVQSTGNNGKTITTKSSTVDINISGGKVIASGINSWAISDSDGKKPTNVKLSGGQVIANNISAYGIYLSSQNSAIDITGGDIIISNGAAYGIVTMNSTIKMTGGRIISTDIGGMAIWSLSTADLVIEGGVVLGRGEKLPDVVYGGGFTTPSGDGVVIVWDKSDDSNVHEKDMSTHLTVFPQGAKAVWNDTGIDYTDASGNKTFIDLGEKYSTLFAPVITTDKLTSGEYDSSYILKVEATGGEPITFSATGLPNGLSIDSDGNITGTPTQAGDFSVEITATNAVATDTKTLGLLIKKIVAPEPTELSKTPEAIYGDTLADVKLPENWNWVDSTQSVGNVLGSPNQFNALYNPDPDIYTDRTIMVDVIVNKAEPKPTVPVGLEATYGDKLSDVKLSAGWAWKDSTLSVGDVSKTGNTFTAIFTPADTDNYNTIEK
ncbi:MAG: hypothetical protein GX896_07500, partial [Clostridiales bacterium]|nr:hypothetical protein [Clostridiales bacterium]